jgi:radical SAM protein (TIGR01212 family)
MKRINFFKDYLVETYGEALYRIPLDLDTSCPNRDETGKGGCSFCSEHGARSMQTMNSESIESQVADSIKFAKKRYGAKQFMLYVQAFSANFNQENITIYEKLLKENCKAISFGTRPDCLNKSAYSYLKQLKEKTNVWVELGVQTIHDKTLKTINRGHDFNCSKVAIKKLNKIGINVAVHVIIGLPGETTEDIINTAKKLSKLPIKAIKIHNLHVLKDTAMGEEFIKNPFPTLQEYEYIDLLVEFLRYLRKDISIIRMTTESLKGTVIAPNWKMNKSHFREYIIKKMAFEDAYQGDKYNKPISTESFEQKNTLDGSITFWSEDFKEHYHDKAGAILEAKEKFLKQANIDNKENIQLLDICFGLGYNSFVSMEYALLNNKTLDITALEIDKRVAKTAEKHLNYGKTFNWNHCLKQIATNGKYSKNNVNLSVLWGDARHLITKLPKKHFDVIYLDAFSSQHNSELWTIDFFLAIKEVIKNDGVLLTYSSAIPVRHALFLAGFHVGETPPVQRERGSTIASPLQSNICNPLPESDIDLFQTTRGIVYKDPFQIWPNKEILRQREFSIKEQKNKKFDIL